MREAVHRAAWTPTRRKVLVRFGTRPEVIKFAPVIHALAARGDSLETIAVSSSQPRLVGPPPARLDVLLADAHRDDPWTARVRAIPNPFGRGDRGERIAALVGSLLGVVAGGNRA